MFPAWKDDNDRTIIINLIFYRFVQYFIFFSFSFKSFISKTLDQSTLLQTKYWSNETLLACKQKHFVCVHSESCENIILAEEKSTRCHFRYFFWWSGLSRKLQQASFNINLRQQIHWIINIFKILLLTISKLGQPWMLIRRSYSASKRTPRARLIQINFFVCGLKL